VDEPHEDGSADDRPQDREGLPADVDHKGLCQLELVGDPGSDQGPYEAENHGDDEPAADLTSDGPAEGAADGRDDDEYDQPWQCDGHVKHLGHHLQQAGCQRVLGVGIVQPLVGMGKAVNRSVVGLPVICKV